MSGTIRDAPIGQIVRFITRNRLLQYPEEKPDFKCPNCYKNPGADEKLDVVREEPAVPNVETVMEEAEPLESEEEVEPREEAMELAAVSTSSSAHSADDGDVDAKRGESDGTDAVDLEKLDTVKTGLTTRTTRTGIERVSSRVALQKSVTRADLEQQWTIASQPKGPTEPIEPEKLDDGTILVDWYSTDDRDNPQNWSIKKKAWASTLIYLYTLSVYMGSAIYAPSEEGVMHAFGVSIDAASLGLSMYVLAYGIGPMLWSPLSEIPIIGRNPPYILSYIIFIIISIPTALVDNFAGLVVLRFLQGFFGSPCLATGGASLGDMYSLVQLPYMLSLWAFAATCGPALGPIISGFSVAAKGWRWSLWEILWMNAPVFIGFFFMPETFGPTILLKRAKRLRKLTGDDRLKSQSELDQKAMNAREVVVEALWRPIQLALLDPSIAFTHGYIALIYGIFYSFFEAFPIVFVGYHGFNLGEQGLSFLSITVGVIISMVIYWAYQYWIVLPSIVKNGLPAPERMLIPALFVTFFCPAGLFMFAWTSRASIHWIVPLIGVCIFTVGIFIIFQVIFLYLSFTYPQFQASLFAGNDLFRSALAAGAIHFSRPLFRNLGVDSGVSLLAALTAGCIAGVYILYFFGATLRARSRFSAK
ncbi:major facilitator superfamily domain-containing protein [Lineolata rhizophorae]|uniref:Major facilitator superfamily domain-containing protein n=1 Tax=Lineolata rhizophorae TaxID=578093 RepID=A0A6A6NZD0_9PEZI|nr:major facilitator superfamily domain-containing protein [Lineolata rhizophorae]